MKKYSCPNWYLTIICSLLPATFTSPFHTTSDNAVYLGTKTIVAPHVNTCQILNSDTRLYITQTQFTAETVSNPRQEVDTLPSPRGLL